MAVRGTRGVKQVVQSVTGILSGRFAGERGGAVEPDYRPPADVAVLATGLRPLDKALGLGGLPCGHITELIGPGGAPLSGGVTAIAARIAARTQRKGQIVSIIDLGRTFNPWLAERCGLIAPQLLLARPETLLTTLTRLEKAARRDGLVVVAMGALADLLGHIETELLKTLLSRLRRIVRQSNSGFLFITTPHDNDPFNPANYPAGFPLAALAEVRLWVQEEAWLHKDDQAVAYKANLTVIQNRLAIPGAGADIKIKLAGQLDETDPVV